MGKTQPKKKSQKFARTYRKFTQVKYQKYRRQFPKIGESQLIAKILKEWEAMDEEAKQSLENSFVQRIGRGFLQDPSSSDKKDKSSPSAGQPMAASSREVKKGKKQIKKKKKPSPKARIFKDSKSPQFKSSSQKNKLFTKVDPDYRKSQQRSKSPGKKQGPEKKSGSSSQLAIKNPKKKNKDHVPPVKQKKKNEEYLNFYKYYYDRLVTEHPRWSRNQITIIIKLLWKKRNISQGQKKKSITKKTNLSGRQLFNQIKLGQGFLKDYIKQLWRALPHQSKKYWQIKGKGKPTRSKKDSARHVRRVLNAGSTKDESIQIDHKTNLDWMNQNVK